MLLFLCLELLVLGSETSDDGEEGVDLGLLSWILLRETINDGGELGERWRFRFRVRGR